MTKTLRHRIPFLHRLYLRRHTAQAARDAFVVPTDSITVEPSTRHFGYDIPTRLLNLTGGGPETFEVIATGHIHDLKRHIDIGPGQSVLEIGCGIGRDAIYSPMCWGRGAVTLE